MAKLKTAAENEREKEREYAMALVESRLAEERQRLAREAAQRGLSPNDPSTYATTDGHSADVAASMDVNREQSEKIRVARENAQRGLEPDDPSTFAENIILAPGYTATREDINQNGAMQTYHVSQSGKLVSTKTTSSKKSKTKLIIGVCTVAAILIGLGTGAIQAFARAAMKKYVKHKALVTVLGLIASIPPFLRWVSNLITRLDENLWSVNPKSITPSRLFKFLRSNRATLFVDGVEVKYDTVETRNSADSFLSLENGLCLVILSTDKRSVVKTVEGVRMSFEGHLIERGGEPVSIVDCVCLFSLKA